MSEEHSCEAMLSEVYSEYSQLKNLIDGIGVSSPNLIWAKGLDGKYIWCNLGLAQVLYRTTIYNVIGSTDMELASQCKSRQGCENFTFGEMCGNSDKEVLIKMKSMDFLERGLVEGEDLILLVRKNVLKDKVGNIIGTVGTGRNVTAEYNAYKSIAKETTDHKTRDRIMDELHKRWFINPDGDCK